MLYDGAPLDMKRFTQMYVTVSALPVILLLLTFVLWFMTESWTYFLPVAAYTTLGWILMYPRPSQVRAWYARQTGAEPVPSIIS